MKKIFAILCFLFYFIHLSFAQNKCDFLNNNFQICKMYSLAIEVSRSIPIFVYYKGILDESTERRTKRKVYTLSEWFKSADEVFSLLR